MGRSPIVPLDSPISVVDSGGGVHLLACGLIDVAQDGPEKADHLPGDGGCCDLVGLFDSEPVEEGVEAVLTLPGVADDAGILSMLASAQ